MSVSSSNAPGLDGNPHSSLTWMHQIDRHARHIGARAALRAGPTTMTWDSLSKRTHRLAQALIERGVGAGDRVAILLTNRFEYVETIVAVNRVGAIAVPVNFRLSTEEIRYVLADSGAVAVVSEMAMDLTVKADKALASVGHKVLHIVVDGDGEHVNLAQAMASASAESVTWPTGTDACALLMYTSGTTGSPKGAMLSYANMNAQTLGFQSSYELFHDDDVALVTSPMFHIAAVGSVLPCLELGVCVSITPTGSFNSTVFLDLVEAHRVTTCFLVPTQWQEVCADQSLAGRDLALRSIAWGASPATPALLSDLYSKFRGVKIVSTFGQTEMSPITAMMRGEDATRKFGSVGRPLSYVEARIVDENMHDVAPGGVGEIVYRGPNVMLGYWNKPEETTEAFAGGWFHSGDLCMEDEDGFLFVIDRLKDMIISGGENIYCAEVESVIADHPQVRDVALVGVPHERWGETPVAFVTPRDPDEPPSAESVIQLCRESLASYKKPSAVIVLSELPRNATGKILKGPLREQATTMFNPVERSN